MTISNGCLKATFIRSVAGEQTSVLGYIQPEKTVEPKNYFNCPFSTKRSLRLMPWTHVTNRWLDNVIFGSVFRTDSSICPRNLVGITQAGPRCYVTIVARFDCNRDERLFMMGTTQQQSNANSSFGVLANWCVIAQIRKVHMVGNGTSQISFKKYRLVVQLC